MLFGYVRLQEDPPAGVSGAPTDNNIMLWNAVIFGYMHWELFDLLLDYCYNLFICNCIFVYHLFVTVGC